MYRNSDIYSDKNGFYGNQWWYSVETDHKKLVVSSKLTILNTEIQENDKMKMAISVTA